mmetsp:Transcript_14468/g.20836  ORF Transcript_14468/g.20836 Transcript_14468/m.20836 type:complete len:163 (+) Transcript_14468:769-1257(+)
MMVSSEAVDGLQGTVTAFFEALGRPDGEEKAAAIFREAAFDDDVTPLPRAKEHVESDDWDLPDKVGLVLTGLSPCGGKIGSARLGDGEVHRFCVSEQCGVASHTRYKVAGVLPRRWYIMGGKTPFSGALSAPSIPASEDGGPIGAAAARRILANNRFLMTKG